MPDSNTLVSFDGPQIKAIFDARGWTLAVAESLTSGNVQAAIGAISGASTFFLGGITTYTIEQKVRHLGVDEHHARAVNAVSARVALEMARGVTELFGAAVGVGTTGYAEPYPQAGISTPFAHFAVYHRLLQPGAEPFIHSGRVQGDPDVERLQMQRLVTAAVLAALQHSLGRMA